ncbi:MAG: ATP-dependent DNA helicase RecG [Candidatus Paceibacterota bacterium]
MPLSLTTRLSDYFRITPLQKSALRKLGLDNIEDLLRHFPVRYGDTAEAKSIDSLEAGESAVIFGKISGLKASKGWKSHITMAEGSIEDETGKIHCIWFNQPYVAKMFSDGMMVRIEGKVSQRRVKKELGSKNYELRKQETIKLDQKIMTSPADSTVPGEEKSGPLYFSNPKIEAVQKLPIGTGDSLFGADGEKHTLYPVYPESSGISSAWIYHNIQKIFKSRILDELSDHLPTDILEKYHLPGLKTAFIWIHTPLTHDDALSARKRFSFEEVFTIQLGKKIARKEFEKYPAFLIETELDHIHEFIRRFPFEATSAQTRAVETIASDMKRGYAMSRLLEGDVGSGKTAVAAAAAYAVMVNRPKKEFESKENISNTAPSESSRPIRTTNLQTAYMCPTEILATQHFESFISFFSYMPIQIGLITGSGCRKFPSKVNPKGWTDISRTQLLQWVENGEIAVLIGTHALIQKSVLFKNLALVIIDEQHRFGVNQRAKLAKKNSLEAEALKTKSKSAYSSPTKGDAKNEGKKPAPHLLSMTATPIPRTLALTMYGDLDLTLLDEIPAGRKPIITELILPAKRAETYEKIRLELQAGRQMFIICPRIDEPDPDKEAALIAKSVKSEALRLKKSVFPEYEIGLLHGKMKPDDKDKVMNDFKEGKIHILCATSVVEVGVNVPNATIIIIEGAERFGLAQLHQLRGRVMRSTYQAYCYAFTETTSVKSIERLKALQSAKNGFELAELDLAQRGSGYFSGGKQWGLSDITMEALRNLKMVEAAREEARRLIEEDLSLSKYPELKKRVDFQAKDSHFE